MNYCSIISSRLNRIYCKEFECFHEILEIILSVRFLLSLQFLSFFLINQTVKHKRHAAELEAQLCPTSSIKDLPIYLYFEKWSIFMYLYAVVVVWIYGTMTRKSRKKLFKKFNYRTHGRGFYSCPLCDKNSVSVTTLYEGEKKSSRNNMTS